MSSIVLEDLSATESLAVVLSRLLKGGEVIGLGGELGAGKTTFVRALAAALNSCTPVSSPSYSLQHEYILPDNRILEHWDLYRLSQAPLDILEPPEANTIRCVEWYQHADLKPDLALHFDLTDSEQARDCSSSGPLSSELIREFNSSRNRG